MSPFVEGEVLPGRSPVNRWLEESITIKKNMTVKVRNSYEKQHGGDIL